MRHSIPGAATIALALALHHQAGAAEPWREQQTLFRAGQRGYATYRIPALVVTPRGTVLAICEGRQKTGSDWDDVDLALRRSPDGGRTWSEIQFIADDGDLTMGNPCPVVDQSTGPFWLPFCRGNAPGRGNAQILLMKSADDEQSWSQPVNISPSAMNPAWPFAGTGLGRAVASEITLTTRSSQTGLNVCR